MQTNLVADAELAEDLAVRYADAEFNRLSTAMRRTGG